MSENHVKPLFVRLPSFLHEYLDTMKLEHNVDKVDMVEVVLSYSMKFWTPEQIQALISRYRYMGLDGLDTIVS